MQGPQRTTQPNGFPINRSAHTRVVRGPFGLLAAAAWSVMHTLGAHHWRDGYETDLERGWSRYRGSRCTICDEPWEGW